MPLLQALEDQAPVCLRLDKGRVVLDVLDQPVDVSSPKSKAEKRGRGSVLPSCMVVVVCPKTLAPLQCRDGGCRVFTDHADIVCTKSAKAP